MPTHELDLSLTANQKMLLDRLKPGHWFIPEHYEPIHDIQTRNTICLGLEKRGILFRRPNTASGYMEWEFCLTADVARRLSAQRRSS